MRDDERQGGKWVNTHHLSLVNQFEKWARGVCIVKIEEQVVRPIVVTAAGVGKEIRDLAIAGRFAIDRAYLDRIVAIVEEQVAYHKLVRRRAITDQRTDAQRHLVIA